MIKRLLILAVTLLLLSFRCYGYDEDVSEYITEEMEEYLPEDILSEDEELGDVINYESLFGMIASFLENAITSVLKNFFVILSMVVICVIFAMLSSTLKSENASRLFSYISSICFALLLYRIMDSLWTRMTGLFDEINVFMNGITPSVTMIYALGGNVTSSAVSNAGMSIVLTVFQDICYHGIRPILQVCFGFSIVSCMSGSVNLAPMAKFVRNTYTTVLVFVISLMTCVMSMQNMLGQAGDSLAMRTVKFASATAVPIVGGSLSEATAGVAGGISALKTTFGILAVLALAAMVLPVLIELWVNKIAFSLGGAICSVFGIDKESELISSAAELINFALAITFSVSLMFIINLCIFASAAVAIGG